MQGSQGKHGHNLNNILYLNGYPQCLIDETLQTGSSSHHHIRHDNTNPNWLYFKIPYISDAVDNRINTLFEKEGLLVRITHKSTKLQQILRPKNNNPTSCNKSECTTSREHLYFVRNIVYRITCSRCYQIYICSTIRSLHDHVKERLSKCASSAYKHFTNSPYRNSRRTSRPGI